ncbi:metallophosphoesterase family protein [Macrococcus sp. DPC7161]|uniref:metallophosphoesterase family protein n=1 Tax=Macrococcus sp. DPC7161 TaxID=2507060 RepID=UPI0013E9476C|nr:metallophosphoesterase family protein [Macrococcus sp. DPC7161]
MYFIVGDVHGCFHTLKKVLKAWDRTCEQLIFVGDYINKGKHSKEVVQLVRQLEREGAICIMGNHEYQMSQYIMQHTAFDDMKENYQYTIKHYDLKKKYRDDVHWMGHLPLYYKDARIFVSHAGVNFLGFRKFNKESSYSVLRYRGKLKRMKQLQVIGHTPVMQSKPKFDAKSNVLNIDTGAGNYQYLSAVRINHKGEVVETISKKIEKEDEI